MVSMKCVIPGVHLKVFGRAIQSLSKIGDELYFEPLDEGLSLRTVNSSRSAYACFQFAPSFFITYMTGCTNDNVDSSSDGLRCKLMMKSIMMVFRSLPTIDKTVEKCKITFDSQEDKLVFQMCCHHGIVKTHNLSFMDSESLQAIFSRDLCPNKLTAGPKLLCDAVLNFQAHQEEVTLILRPDYIALKNYVEDDPNPSRIIHTELTLSPDEFDHFQVGVDTDVTFCLKEFRAILAFADLTNLPLNLHIESTGKPVTFSITSDLSFEANIVLATLANEEDLLNQTPTNTARRNDKQTSKRQQSETSKRKNVRTPFKNRESNHKSVFRDDDDEDTEMVSMNIISDTTVLEPHSRGKSDTEGYSLKQGLSTTSRNVQNKNYNSNGFCHKTNKVINLDSDVTDKVNSSSSRSNTTNGHSTKADPVPTTSGRNEMGGFYVSASEESQSQQEIEIPCGRGECHNNKQITSADDNFDDDISQIIPMRDETSLNHASTDLSTTKNDDRLRDEEEEEEEVEQICGTPPSKRFRSLFFNTQSSTQSTLPSQNKPAILCPNSDSDD